METGVVSMSICNHLSKVLVSDSQKSQQNPKIIHIWTAIYAINIHTIFKPVKPITIIQSYKTES